MNRQLRLLTLGLVLLAIVISVGAFALSGRPEAPPMGNDAVRLAANPAAAARARPPS